MTSSFKPDDYDAIFSKSDNYNCAVEKSSFFPVWNGALTILLNCSIKKVLDLGCGTGQFGSLCEQAGIDFTGVDFSPVAIAKAKQKIKKGRVIQYDIKSFLKDYPDKYDCYVLLEVLEHLVDDLSVFGLMPSGSTIMFSVPNYLSEGHIRCFQSPQEIREYYGSVINVFAITTIKLFQSNGTDYGNKIYIVFGEVK
jgi:2-polyprenyl-3-methyl-5-hydroxy-6-metoxy-1,4-benzoquinol methylase